MPETRLVTTRAELLDALPAFAGATRLALDCESNGMHAWRGRLCLLQLAAAPADAGADLVCVVDALAVGSLDALAPLLGAEGPPKILHDAGFDARLLRDAGVVLGNVLDTSVMARFLGCRETGLGSLLAQRFGVALDKSLQQHDWARRPLGPRELGYLAGDVADLGRLAASLEADVAVAGIADEVAEEAAYALRAALADEGAAGWWRVKGVRDLAPAGRAVARALWHARERVAEQRDVPPGRVFSNASLVQLARARPRAPADVRASGLLGAASAGGVAEAVAAAVAEGLAAGDVPEAERRWLAPGAPARRPCAPARARDRAPALACAEEAARRKVDLQVVLPGHRLADLAASARAARPTSRASTASARRASRATARRWSSGSPRWRSASTSSQGKCRVDRTRREPARKATKTGCWPVEET
ncbi:MAG: ribonuclease D [Polyangiales bacterium]